VWTFPDGRRRKGAKGGLVMRIAGDIVVIMIGNITSSTY